MDDLCRLGYFYGVVMGKIIDLTGQRFKNWTILELCNHKDNSKNLLWKCKCDCGNIAFLHRNNLKDTYIKKCIDCCDNELVGHQFGKWTVIAKSTKKYKYGNIKWSCQCKCGFIRDVARGDLLSKQSTQCKSCSHKSKLPDLTNTRFGKWLVLESDTDRPLKRSYWLCLCDCGNTQSITSYNLRSGISTQCRTCSHKKNGYKDITGTYFSNLRATANRRQIQFALTPKELYNIFIQQDKKCALSGIPITISKTSQNISRNQTASVDRIDSNGIYICSNVWFVHKTINLIKGQLKLEDLLYFCNAVTHSQHNNHPNDSIYCKYSKGWAGYGNISNALWDTYKNSYKYRVKNIMCELSIEQAWDKFVQQQGYCALTGLPIEFFTPHECNKYGKVRTASLDRINSDLNYTMANTQWIHKSVNKIKWDIPETQFTQWCKRISNHNGSKNDNK